MTHALSVRRVDACWVCYLNERVSARRVYCPSCASHAGTISNSGRSQHRLTSFAPSTFCHLSNFIYRPSNTPPPWQPQQGPFYRSSNSLSTTMKKRSESASSSRPLKVQYPLCDNTGLLSCVSMKMMMKRKQTTLQMIWTTWTLELPRHLKPAIHAKKPVGSSIWSSCSASPIVIRTASSLI